jgi:hypothetical protein
MLIADLAIFVAAAAALGPLRKARVWLPVSACVGAIAVLVIATDGFGANLSAAHVVSSGGESVRLGQSSAESIGREMNILITNEGKRDLHLVGAPSYARNAYLYVLERRIGEHSWAKVSGQAAAFWDTPGAGLTIAPAKQANVTVALPEGQYRVLLHSSATSNTQEFPFTVIVPQLEALTPRAGPSDQLGILPPDLDGGEDGTTTGTHGLEVELGGIMTRAGASPIFLMKIHYPNRRSQRQRASMGQRLYGAWVVSEFNESLSTVTISNGEDILVLARGQRVALGE